MWSTESRRIRVAVEASDPITHAGIRDGIETGNEFDLVVTGHVAEADVVVLAPERLDGDVLSYLRRSAAGHRKPVVLVIDENTLPDVVTAVEYGLVAIVGRQMASTEDLLHSVSAAATGGGVTSPDMLERLQAQVENVQRRTLSPHGDPAATLTARDVDIMRMLADGLDTAQIAGELSYSVRTVKNLISSLMTRLDLRNRPQVVAYAIRTGAI